MYSMAYTRKSRLLQDAIKDKVSFNNLRPIMSEVPVPTRFRKLRFSTLDLPHQGAKLLSL